MVGTLEMQEVVVKDSLIPIGGRPVTLSFSTDENLHTPAETAACVYSDALIVQKNHHGANYRLE